MDHEIGVLWVLFYLGLNYLVVPVVGVIILIIMLKLTISMKLLPRTAVILGVAFLYYFILVGDTHLGRAYVKRLCNESEIVTVSRIIGVPNSMWSTDGWPKFHSRSSEKRFLPHVLKNKYMRTHNSEKIDSYFNVKESITEIIEVDSGESLVSIHSYHLYEGWLARLMSPNSTRLKYSCGWNQAAANVIPGSAYNDKLTSHVFVPESPI